MNNNLKKALRIGGLVLGMAASGAIGYITGQTNAQRTYMEVDQDGDGDLDYLIVRGSEWGFLLQTNPGVFEELCDAKKVSGNKYNLITCAGTVIPYDMGPSLDDGTRF